MWVGPDYREGCGKRLTATLNVHVLKLREEIEAIQGPLPDDEDNDDEGGIPQFVKELAPRYPRINTPPNLRGQIRPL